VGGGSWERPEIKEGRYCKSGIINLFRGRDTQGKKKRQWKLGVRAEGGKKPDGT